MVHYASMVNKFLNTKSPGDVIISRDFVLWVRRNYSIPLHPRTAVKYLDRSKRLKRHRLRPDEQRDFYLSTGRWVKIVWIVQM